MKTLTQYLKDEKISQTDFAGLLNVVPSAVNRWCNGQRPKFSKMAEIEKITNGAVPIAVWTSPQSPAENAA